MPVSSFTIAPAVENFCDRNPAIAACSVHTVPCRVPRFRPVRRRHAVPAKPIAGARTNSDMKLHIISDLHLSVHPFAPPRTDADVVVLAGDIARPPEAIAWAQGFKKPVVLVPGNHEFTAPVCKRQCRR
jgi:hypothetical protein